MFSVRGQCQLLDINRAGLFYRPVEDGPEELMRMNAIDKIFTDYPFYGSRKISVELISLMPDMNREKVRRLMGRMGLRAIFPMKKKISGIRQEHKIYPYLLDDFEIVRPGQVWSTDITYIPVRTGFFYLVAIIDWFSRYVLSWRLSNSMETSFCLDALDEALAQGTPDIFNMDQGAQFTSSDFTGRIEQTGALVSMDGKGRCFDNIFVERLWRSLKYEEVYINGYVDGHDAFNGIKKYFDFYNNKRIHQALQYRTPADVHMAA